MGEVTNSPSAKDVEGTSDSCRDSGGPEGSVADSPKAPSRISGRLPKIELASMELGNVEALTLQMDDSSYKGPTRNRQWTRTHYHFMAEEYGWVMGNEFLVARWCCGDRAVTRLRKITAKAFFRLLILGLFVTLVGFVCGGLVEDDTCRISFTLMGALPICTLMWLTMNHKIVRKVAVFWTPYWMMFNYTVFAFLYMYMERLSGVDLFLSIIAWFIIMPCFGWTDAAPFEVRIQFSLLCYGTLTVYYSYWFISFFVIEDAFGKDHTLSVGGIEFHLSSIAASANANLIIFTARYWWNIYQNRNSFVIWREQVKIFDEQFFQQALTNADTPATTRSPSSSRLIYMTQAESIAWQRDSFAKERAKDWLTANENEKHDMSLSNELIAPENQLMGDAMLSPDLAYHMSPKNSKHILDLNKRRKRQQAMQEQLELIEENSNPHVIQPKYNTARYISRDLAGWICFKEENIERLRRLFINKWKYFFMWGIGWHVVNFIMYIHSFGIDTSLISVLQPFFITIGFLPLSVCFWLTLNWGIVRNLVQFLMLWWMMANYTIGTMVWLYISNTPYPYFFAPLSLMTWILGLPFFGLTDACPEEIRASFTRAVYLYLSAYYILWTGIFTFFKSIDNDDTYTFQSMSFSLSSMIVSTNFNLACFSLRYLFYIMYDPHTFVIWTSRIVVKPLTIEAMNSIAATPAIPDLTRDRDALRQDTLNRKYALPGDNLPTERENAATPSMHDLDNELEISGAARTPTFGSKTMASQIADQELQDRWDSIDNTHMKSMSVTVSM